MAVSIDIDDRGLATLAIAGADGELGTYRFRLAPRGLSLWALEVTRADTDATYRVWEESPGRWNCSCLSQVYRKRGAEMCKHVQAIRLLRAWLKSFLETTHERCSGSGDRTAARRAL